jgi:hypothetical protein
MNLDELPEGLWSCIQVDRVKRESVLQREDGERATVNAACEIGFSCDPDKLETRVAVLVVEFAGSLQSRLDLDQAVGLFRGMLGDCHGALGYRGRYVVEITIKELGAKPRLTMLPGGKATEEAK